MADPFSGFVSTLRYRFLPLLMLVFLLINAITGRDFGPMLDEERAASLALTLTLTLTLTPTLTLLDL